MEVTGRERYWARRWRRLNAKPRAIVYDMRRESRGLPFGHPTLAASLVRHRRQLADVLQRQRELWESKSPIFFKVLFG